MPLYDIRDFGAVGDGVRVNTRAVQDAIDACSRDGGGVVLVSVGRHVTGTIVLKDNVLLQVERGATLLGSADIRDYAADTHKNMYRDEPHMDRCLIFARDAGNIGIQGGGTIDGRGGKENFPNADDPAHNRPMLIRFMGCKNIRVRDITLRSPAAWTSAWLYCSDIVVDGVTIHSRTNYNGDGLDFDGCRNVRVNNCAFDTSDDSICLQASQVDTPCQDVAISNCTFCSQWAGIRIGLLSRGDIFNVTVTNCIFRQIKDAGLKIQLCEGGEMKNMIFSNLVMQDVPRPVFLTFCQLRACVDAPPGLAPMKALRDMIFSNILIDNSLCDRHSALILVGLKGHPVENILLNNIHMITAGGGTAADASSALPDLDLEHLQGAWPEYPSFGRTVPCHGIYAGHLRGLTIRSTLLRTREKDERPAIFCDDVVGLELDGAGLENKNDGKSPVHLQDCPKAVIKKTDL